MVNLHSKINSKNSLVHSDDKDLGCSVKLSIDQIEIPLSLLNQSDKDRLNIFAQYRFYDKGMTRTKRRKNRWISISLSFSSADYHQAKESKKNQE